MGERFKYEKWLVSFALLGDAILVNATIIAAFLIRFQGKPPAFNFSAYLNIVPTVTFEMCLFYYIFELYNTRRKHRKAVVMINAFKGVSMGFIVLTGLTFFYRQFSFPRLVLTIFYFLNLAFVTLWHVILSEANNYLYYLSVKSRIKTRILLIGADRAGQKVARKLYKHAQHKLNIVGFLDDRTDRELKIQGLHVLGRFKDLKNVITEKDIDEVIFSTPSLSSNKMMELLQSCIELDTDFKVVPELLDVAFGMKSFNYEYGLPLIDLKVEPVGGWQANLKRIIEIICAFSGLMIMLTIAPIIIIIELITDPGPLFYKQERLGKGGRPFALIKFRTMYQGAEDGTGPVWAKNKDTRITGIGRFLRRTKLDELPQVVNILKGEMSIVGPRPERPAFAKPFLATVPFYKNRLLVSPGLTGWAQINQDADETVRDVKSKLQYDLHYIENMSVLFDIEIILKTAIKLMRQYSYTRQLNKKERKKTGKLNGEGGVCFL